MLKQRFYSGFILAAAILAEVLWLSTPGLAVAMALLFLTAAWEWAALTSIHKIASRLTYLVLLGLLMVTIWLLRETMVAPLVLLLASALWGVVVFFLWTYARHEGEPARWQKPLALVGLIFLAAAWLAFTELHRLGYGWLFYLLALCAIADSMAYLSGKLLGKHKLAPELSPGKTIEGMLGGLAGVLILALLTTLWLQWSLLPSLSLILLSLVAGLISVEGDLFESLVKREAGAKDSGKILPGHGGILDRFDSHVAAAPFFVLGLDALLEFM